MKKKRSTGTPSSVKHRVGRKTLAENTDRVVARKRVQLRAGLKKLAAATGTRVAADTSSSLRMGGDPDDAPELTKEYFERADFYHGDKLVRRGRPPSVNPKRALKLRLDADVIEHFRATGRGWQTRINETLRAATKVMKRRRNALRELAKR